MVQQLVVDIVFSNTPEVFWVMFEDEIEKMFITSQNQRTHRFDGLHTSLLTSNLSFPE